MTKIIPMPQSNRQTVLNQLFWLKKAARMALLISNIYRDTSSILDRSRRVLTDRGSLFDRHRIEQLTKDIEAGRGKANESIEQLVEYGQGLIAMFPLAEKYLSFHDKCQVLGLNHMEAKARFDGDESASLEKMIFVNALEYRGNDETLFGHDLECPLWSIMYARITHEMIHNAELRQAGEEIVDEMFRDLPRYQMQINFDGTETFTRMPPKLRLVKREAHK